MAELWVVADPSEATVLADARDPAENRISLSLSDRGLTPTDIMGLIRILCGLDFPRQVELLCQKEEIQSTLLVFQVPQEWIAALASVEDARRPEILAKWPGSVDELVRREPLWRSRLTGRLPAELEEDLAQLSAFARKANQVRTSVLYLDLPSGMPAFNQEPPAANLNLEDVPTLKNLVLLTEQRGDPPEFLASGLSLLAHALWKEGSILEGLTPGRRAVTIYERLLQEGRTDLDERAGPLAFNLASILVSQGAMAESMANFRCAGACYKRLVDSGASEYRLPYADARDKLGACLVFEGALQPMPGTTRPDFLAEAKVVLREAIALFEQMIQEGHRELRPILAASKQNLKLASQGGKGEIRFISAPQLQSPRRRPWWQFW